MVNLEGKFKTYHSDIINRNLKMLSSAYMIPWDGLSEEATFNKNAMKSPILFKSF